MSDDDFVLEGKPSTSKRVNPTTTGVDLYNIYRPQTLDDIIGQPLVVQQVQGWIDRGQIPRFIICHSDKGGTGKNCILRILAKHVFGMSETDDPMTLKTLYMEVPATTTGRKSDLEDLIEKVKNPPLSVPPYNRACILVIDELQGITKAALDTLLHITENPPAHLYIWASTTDIAKIKQMDAKGALMSRATKLDLKRLVLNDLLKLIYKIQEKEQIQIPNLEQAVMMIAQKSDGSARAAITYLDSIRYAKSIEEVKRILGLDIPEEDALSDKLLTILTLNGYFDNLKEWKIYSGSDADLWSLILEYVHSHGDKESARLKLVASLSTMLGGGKTRPSPSNSIKIALGKEGFKAHRMGNVSNLLFILLKPEVTRLLPAEGFAPLLAGFWEFLLKRIK